jgi:transmembrane sensor
MTDIDWDLLFRYAGGDCSAEERARFEAWLASDPMHRAMFDAAATAAGRTLERMPNPRPRVHVSVARPPRPLRASPLVTALAASLMIGVASTLLWRTTKAPVARTGAAQLRVATTGRGERARLHLSDGTLVILGAASTLRYPADLSGGSRELFLEGEAYFEVTHDAKRPFRVHAGRATAEDLGTRFGVRAYDGDSTVRVVVADGEVALGIATPSTAARAVLKRGQLGRLVDGQTVASVRQVDPDRYLGWTTGRLEFDDVPLAEAAAQLERWYAVEIRIADSKVASQRLTASFANESLTEVLAVLAPALDVRFERRGDTVVVSQRTHGR